ncbi:WD40 repeat-like protein, partial [Testicularia cyperi]
TNPSSTLADWELSDPPTDTVSAIVFAPGQQQSIAPPDFASTSLLVSSWDGFVHHYSLPLPSLSMPESGAFSQASHRLQRIQHEAPVLDVCYVSDTLAASASLDRRVRLLDLSTGRICVLGKHEDAVVKIRYCPQTGLLFSGSWDRTVKVWRVETDESEAARGKLLQTLTMSDKVLAMDVSRVPTQACGSPTAASPRLVVGMVGRTVFVYDLLPLAASLERFERGEQISDRDWQPDQRRESSLKYMMRDLRAMPAGDGYATSSIEGRIAVEFFDPSPKVQQLKYAFKCHRQPASSSTEAKGGDSAACDIVFPVHGLAFHPVHGTFASLGGDSVVSIWDAAAKKRVRQYPKLPSAVSAGAVDSTGQLLVVATGAESGAYTETEPDCQPPTAVVQLIVKANAWEECKPKVKA